MTPIFRFLPFVGLGFDDLALGVLFLELDFLASQLVDPFFLGSVGLDDEPDLGAARPSNVADHVVELLLDQVDRLAVLLDADDLVFGLEPAVLVGGHAGDDLGHDRVAILGPKLGADSLEREVKRLVVHVLPILGPQIGGVGIEGLGEVGQIGLEQLAGIDLVDLPVAVAIANRPLLDRLVVADVFDDFRVEQVEFHFLPQPGVGFGFVGREIDLVGIVRQVFVDGEVLFLLEQLHLGLEPLVVARHIPIEDLLGEIDVSFFDLVVEGVGFLLEFLDVRL